MTPERLRSEQKETVGPPEMVARYRLKTAGTIAIYGEEGAGKSNLSERLAKALGARTLAGGKEIRTKLGGSTATVGFQKRPLSVDQDYDSYQHRLMTESNPNDPLVNESRLSGFIATRIMDEDPSIEIIRINITCPKRERIRRITKRAIDEWEEKKAGLLENFARGEIAFEEFEARTQELTEERKELTFVRINQKETVRRKSDSLQWAEEWPELSGKDVLNPGTKIDGKRLYDLTLSTGKRTKKETFDFVINWLWENGKIEGVVKREDFGPGQAGELAYQTVLGDFPCETWIDDNKTVCGKPPVGTVDVDNLANHDPIPVCSEEHATALEKQIREELKRKSKPGIAGMGRNGWGRT